MPKIVILSHTSNFSTTAAGPHWKKRFDALTSAFIICMSCKLYQQG